MVVCTKQRLGGKCSPKVTFLDCLTGGCCDESLRSPTSCPQSGNAHTGRQFIRCGRSSRPLSKLSPDHHPGGHWRDRTAHEHPVRCSPNGCAPTSSESNCCPCGQRVRAISPEVPERNEVRRFAVQLEDGASRKAPRPPAQQAAPTRGRIRMGVDVD
jgi:hypothetical protein